MTKSNSTSSFFRGQLYARMADGLGRGLSTAARTGLSGKETEQQLFPLSLVDEAGFLSRRDLSNLPQASALIVTHIFSIPVGSSQMARR